MKDHLFVSSSSGALYDTRADNWSMQPPLRAIYQRGFNEITNTQELRAALRAGQFTDLGGYPLYFITSDGAALSFEAVRSELREVLESITHRVNDGWRVVACAINYENDELVCEHTGKPIPSAYGETEE